MNNKMGLGGTKLSESDLARLEAAGVKFIRVTFVDNAGIVRAKSVPLARLASACRSGLGASYTFGVFTGLDQIAAHGTLSSRVGDLRLVPDPAALRYRGDWAWVPADQYDQEGAPWPLDSRGLLKRVVAGVEAEGYALKMAFELEFVVSRTDGNPVHGGPAYGADALMQSRAFLEHLVPALIDHGVEVPQFHAEGGVGQLEFSLPPADPLRAVDDVVLARCITTEAAFDLGLRASFAPVAGSGRICNGRHLHFSLWREDANLFGNDAEDPIGLSATGRSFLAGVTERLPEILAIGCASPISRFRLNPGAWTGAYKCWGVENREAAVRFIRGTKNSRPNGANAEVKCLDATGNPYLTAAVVIAAGMDGVRRGTPLPAEATGDPGALSAEERRIAGFSDLSADLMDGATTIETSQFLSDVLGSELATAIAAVRRSEAQNVGDWDETRLIEAYQWRH